MKEEKKQLLFAAKLGKLGGEKSAKSRFKGKTKEEISEAMSNIRRGKTVCIDLDGTLCKQQPFGDGFIEGEPKQAVKEALDGFKKTGYKIIILTTRLNPSFGGDIEWKKDRIIAWMNKYELPFDEITNNKPSATLYIDNKAVRFMDWEEVIRTWKLQ
uniref:Uncharacterized protein n=1 Tax=viral metagenome TaxID=1070528 RepID=A0A6H1ZSF1_9ZZZZ